jgi:hypothetical protein
MLYKEIITVCSEIHTKHINTVCGQNVELLKVKPGGTCYLLLRLKWLDTHLSSGNMFSMYHWNGLQDSWLFTSSCSCKLQRETFGTILCRTFLSRKLCNDIVSHKYVTIPLNQLKGLSCTKLNKSWLCSEMGQILFMRYIYKKNCEF